MPTNKSTVAVHNVDTLRCVKALLRERLGQCWVPENFSGFEKEKRELYDLLKRTVSFGESNSVIVIGARGIGKSMLLKSTLNDICKDKSMSPNLLQVRLNGLLQTDDKIALKEIACQLQLENTFGDKVLGSFAENLQFLLEALKSGDDKSKPIIFILEEFDLFAQHHNQTLLYNLFDVAQSAQTPICVLGLTCRMDIMELLEKRVKSRFSHRQIHLFNQLHFKEYVEIFKQYLQLPDKFVNPKFALNWNNEIEKISQDSTVQDLLKRQFNISKDIRKLKSFLLQPVCKLSENHPTLLVSDFIDSFKLVTNDSKSSLLQGLSILELCLIIAMKHLTEIYDGEPFNFEIIYSEYLRFARQRSSMQIFEKSVVLKAFEHLQALELVKPLDAGSTRTQKEYRPVILLVHPIQLKEVLQKYPSCPTEIKHWAISSLA